MAEPDTDVIQLKPPEESQCLTASPATCTITIKGYYRHSSILHMPKSRLAPLPFTSALPFSVITFLPSTHHLPALPFSRPVHHCPCDIIWFLSITLSLSFTLFRCYTVSFPLWRHPRASSVSLQGLHSRCLLCHDDATGDADIFCKWHRLIASSHLVLFVIVYLFYFISCVHLLRFAWVACFRVGFTASLCRKKRREEPCWKQPNIRSIMVMKDQYCMATKCW